MTNLKLAYSLADIEKIKNNNFDYTISNKTLEMISLIASQVGAENYVKTPQFNSKNRTNKNANQEDWAAIRNFKITERVEKQGVDKFLQELRGELNKLTEKNFDSISENILEKMTSSFVDENKDQIAKHIFEIASTNKFYSSVYARLFKIIINKFDYMQSILSNNFDNYINLFDVINSVDPNKHYDRFCEINKENERRKAMSQFFVNLMHEELIEKQQIMSILNSLFKMMFDYVGKNDKKAEGVEIVENIFIIVKSIKTSLTENELSEIKSKVDLMVATKPSQNNSMTNKILFKYMDLSELL